MLIRLPHVKLDVRVVARSFDRAQQRRIECLRVRQQLDGVGARSRDLIHARQRVEQTLIIDFEILHDPRCLAGWQHPFLILRFQRCEAAAAAQALALHAVGPNHEIRHDADVWKKQNRPEPGKRGDRPLFRQNQMRDGEPCEQVACDEKCPDHEESVMSATSGR